MYYLPFASTYLYEKRSSTMVNMKKKLRNPLLTALNNRSTSGIQKMKERIFLDRFLEEFKKSIYKHEKVKKKRKLFLRF